MAFRFVLVALWLCVAVLLVGCDVPRTEKNELIKIRGAAVVGKVVVEDGREATARENRRFIVVSFSMQHPFGELECTHLTNADGVLHERVSMSFETPGAGGTAESMGGLFEGPAKAKPPLFLQCGKLPPIELLLIDKSTESVREMETHALFPRTAAAPVTGKQ